MKALILRVRVGWTIYLPFNDFYFQTKELGNTGSRENHSIYLNAIAS